jgi:hypothetical protein
MTTLKDSGAREQFDTGSQRDSREGKGRYDLLPMHAMERLAKVYEAGAVKYDANNWRKGQPVSRYLDSALRHLCRFAEGHRDEDHAAQAMWNIAAVIETEEMVRRGFLSPELSDLPSYVEKML